MPRHNIVTSVSPKTPVPAANDSSQAAVDQDANPIEAVRGRLVELADEARQRGEALAERARDLASTRPLTAVVVAFGAGYLAMRIATSKLTQLAAVGGLLYLAGGALRK
jgi:hypothetical protein